MFCKNCAAPIDEKANYCSSCGHAQNTTGKSNAAPKWFKWLLGFVIAAGIAGFFLAANAEDLTDAVYDQLKALKKNKITEAYYSFTSKEFQEATSLEQFKAFLTAYPILTQTKGIRFIDKINSENIGTLEAFLTNADNKEIKAQYRIIKEGDKWKILSISLEDSTPSLKQSTTSNTEKTEHKPLEFSQFVLGTAVDEEGRITQGQTIFNHLLPELYLNLYIANGIKDAQIEVELEHLDTHSKIAPIKTKLTEDGHAILTFVFSPPPTGWPKGNYQVMASTPSGAQNHYDFKIE